MKGLKVALVGHDPLAEAWLRADPGLEVSTSPSACDAAVVLGQGEGQLEGARAAINLGVPIYLHQVPTEVGLVELARIATAPLSCWWGHRQLSAMVGLRKEMNTGRIGLPTDLTVQFWLPAPVGAEGDPLPLLGAAADLAVWLTGCAAVAVYATNVLHGGAVRLATASLMLKDRVPVSLTAGWAWGLSPGQAGYPSVRATVVGTHGVMHVSTDRPAHLLTGRDGRTQPVLLTADQPRQPARELTAALAQAPTVSAAAAETARSVAMMRSLVLSAETGSVQQITEP